MENLMATTEPTAQKRKAKTAAEIRADIEAAKQKLASAEAREYGTAIEAALKKANVVSSINVVKANVEGATDLLLLRKIGEMLGIKRLIVTQSEVKKRKPKQQ